MAERTPILGLSYTGDAAMNLNLDRIDAAFGKLGLLPPAPYVPPEGRESDADTAPAPAPEPDVEPAHRRRR